MKRIFKIGVSLLIIGVLSLTSAFSVGAAALPVYGDVDGNGKVSVLDVTDIQKHLVNLSELSQDALVLADYNGDGNVDVFDVTDIQKMLVNFDYKYAHELYEVENVEFLPEDLTPLEFSVDRCTRPYFDVRSDYLYDGTCNKHLVTLFKTYDEYGRFFEATFDEYDERFFYV